MIQQKPSPFLLTEDDLPDTDNQPVDNELQILAPTLLRAILILHWAERTDWFMGINLGVYYDADKPAIGPDGFLSLGVPLFRPNGKLRLSYVIAQEHGVVPQWVLEVVSQQAGGEYSDKMQEYAGMGVLYYTIFNPSHWQRDRHEPFEVYRLEQGVYARQPGNPLWMPELNLGIGVEVGSHDAGPPRQWLYWYDAQGNRLPAPENVIALERQRAEQERQRAEQERQRAEHAQQKVEQQQQQRENLEKQLTASQQQLATLLEKLRRSGIDPDTLQD
jgi:Uma2 family endonuclease